jgi:hypothetical protein
MLDLSNQFHGVNSGGVGSQEAIRELVMLEGSCVLCQTAEATEKEKQALKCGTI